MKSELQIFDGIEKESNYHLHQQLNLKLSQWRLRVQHLNEKQHKKRQRHCVPQQLPSMDHLQAIRTQHLVCDNRLWHAQASQKLEHGIVPSTFQGQDTTFQATCGTSTLPVYASNSIASFMRHVTTMNSPPVPNYVATERCPIESINYLRTEPTFDNIVAHQSYLEKLHFDQNSVKFWVQHDSRSNHG